MKIVKTRKQQICEEQCVYHMKKILVFIYRNYPFIKESEFNILMDSIIARSDEELVNDN